MRPAVEHAIRTGYLKRAITVPFSLFLENIWDEDKHTVITVGKTYDGKEGFLVKRWDIDNINKRQILPSCKENTISKDELFVSEYTVIRDYRTLSYFHGDYTYEPEPNDTDINTEQWVREEQENYCELMEKYFFSYEHKFLREEILWKSFMQGFMKKSYDLYLNNIISLYGQQCIIKEANYKMWKTWLIWKRYLLDFSDKIAPELVFQQEYEEKMGQNEDYLNCVGEKIDSLSNFFEYKNTHTTA